MHISSYLTICTSVASVSAQVLQGFNYGSTYTDGSAITESGYEAQFNAAKDLVGQSGFSSARLFTSIQKGTTNTPSEAFQAAINSDTRILLGLWGSAGQANIDNELAALQSAISAGGSRFADLVVGISVGSEDLYRISPTGIENNSGVGAEPDEIASYITQVKQALDNGPLSGKPVGHVDTWTVWVNSSNNAVRDASDFIGMDAYPYFQNTFSNGIDSGAALFQSAYDQTVAAAAGKDVWVTETGWPVSGPTENLAEANPQNAKTYWDNVGCAKLFGKVNTFWFTLQDAFPTSPSPSFGIVGKGSSTTDIPTRGLFELSCSDSESDTATSSSAIPSSANAAPSQQAVGSGSGSSRENAVEEAEKGSGKAASGPTSSTAQKQGSPAPSGAGNESKDQDSSTEAPSSSAKQPGPSATQQVPSQQSASSVSQPTTLITKTTALPSASVSATGCPASLSGQFEYPHLIVPVDKAQPDKALGTSYNGTASPGVSSIFNFDFPTGLDGMTCTLVFLLPKQTDLTTSSFTISGSGGIDVERLKEPATEQTTFNHQPAHDQDLGGPSNLESGSEYLIASGPCFTGRRVAYKLSTTGGLELNYFQHFNPSPIGLFVTVC